MASNIAEELDIFPGLLHGADWTFDDFDEQNWDEQDWALWDALEGVPGEGDPSSSATFHTASPPPPPRLSPEPHRRHAPSARVSAAAQSEQPRRPTTTTTTTSSSPSFPSAPGLPRHPVPRSPRLAYTRSRGESGRRRSASRDVWRDRTAARPIDTLGDLPDNHLRLSPATSPSFASDDFDDAIDIDDLLASVSSDSDSENMAPNTRRQRIGGGVVDLTDDSPPPAQPSPRSRQPQSLKRSAQGAARGQSDSKRRRPATGPLDSEQPDAAVEMLDLTNEAPSAEEELAQSQTAALIAQQASNSLSSSGPLKIGQRQCIICMENFTNITITSCGHVYCHECLTQALLAGEKNSESGKANCPVCRKHVNRKAKNQVIPLSFMKRSQFKGKARKGVAVLG